MRIDIALSENRNVIKKETAKMLKFKDFTIEMERVWNVRKSDTNNGRGNWNHLKMIQKVRLE